MTSGSSRLIASDGDGRTLVVVLDRDCGYVSDSRGWVASGPLTALDALRAYASRGLRLKEETAPDVVVAHDPDLGVIRLERSGRLQSMRLGRRRWEFDVGLIGDVFQLNGLLRGTVPVRGTLAERLGGRTDVVAGYRMVRGPSPNAGDLYRPVFGSLHVENVDVSVYHARLHTTLSVDIPNAMVSSGDGSSIRLSGGGEALLWAASTAREITSDPLVRAPPFDARPVPGAAARPARVWWSGFVGADDVDIHVPWQEGPARWCVRVRRGPFVRHGVGSSPLSAALSAFERAGRPPLLRGGHSVV